jgi:predicted DNA-binding ArsR family transcriptional regulator
MTKEVIINDYPIKVSKLTIHQQKEAEDSRTHIEMEFQVTSEEYHDITVLLYENDFTVKVPEEKLEIKATIHRYSTSITDLYKKGNVGDFQLALIEKM